MRISYSDRSAAPDNLYPSSDRIGVITLPHSEKITKSSPLIISYFSYKTTDKRSMRLSRRSFNIKPTQPQGCVEKNSAEIDSALYDVDCLVFINKVKLVFSKCFTVRDDFTVITLFFCPFKIKGDTGFTECFEPT